MRSPRSKLKRKPAEALPVSFGWPNLDRKVFEVVSSFEEADRRDREYWWSRTPAERMWALERLRELNYGYGEINLDPDFKDFLKLLNSRGVKYLVLGGYAVNYHGYHRFTGDLDVWVAVDKENATRLSKALRDFGFSASRVHYSKFLETDLVFQMGRVPVRIDIFTGTLGVEFDQCHARRVEATIEDVTVPFISLADLRVNKRAIGRHKDLADLENLPPNLPKRKQSRKPRRKPS